MLRRLLKAQERQAAALEEIAKIVRIQFGGIAAPAEVYPEGDDDFSFASDNRTFWQQHRDATRIRRYASDDDGDS